MRAWCSMGVNNRKLGQDGALEAFHCFGLVVMHVIVSRQMQEAMHREMDKMICERFALRLRLTRGRLVGNDDITEQSSSSMAGGDALNRK